MPSVSLSRGEDGIELAIRKKSLWFSELKDDILSSYRDHARFKREVEQPISVGASECTSSQSENVSVMWCFGIWKHIVLASGKAGLCRKA